MNVKSNGYYFQHYFLKLTKKFILCILWIIFTLIINAILHLPSIKSIRIITFVNWVTLSKMNKYSRFNRALATFLMVLLLVSAAAIFPYIMTPEPPIFLLLWLCFIPVFVLFYFIFLAIFIWWHQWSEVAAQGLHLQYWWFRFLRKQKYLDWSWMMQYANNIWLLLLFFGFIYEMINSTWNSQNKRDSEFEYGHYEYLSNLIIAINARWLKE
jgi:hypothetical protein